MRIVHITGDGRGIGGASIATLRMHLAMFECGIDTHVACKIYPDMVNCHLFRFSQWAKFKIFCLKAAFKLLSGMIPSTGFVTTGLANFVNTLEPDVVVLHWLQMDTLGVREILRIRSSVFWFHHDLWPIRGITAHEWFKVPPRFVWLDRLVRWNKRRVAQRMGNRLIPVCASQWVADEIRKSGMYATDPVVIPLPLDEVFKPAVRHPSVKFRILNGARGGLDAGLKGGDRLLAALNLIPDVEKTEMELVVFGEEGTAEERNGVMIRFVGRLQGEALAQAYRDADVFAFPSRQETFGQTKIEALACGTPVVAFDETACAEGIHHKENGWVAAADDIAGFAEGIRYFYTAWKRGESIRVVGDKVYSAESVAQKWMNVIKGCGDETTSA